MNKTTTRSEIFKHIDSELERLINLLEDAYPEIKEPESIIIIGDYTKQDNLQEVVLSFMKEHGIKEEGSLFMNRGAVFINGDLKVLYVKDREINHFAIRYTPKKGA